MGVGCIKTGAGKGRRGGRAKVRREKEISDFVLRKRRMLQQSQGHPGGALSPSYQAIIRINIGPFPLSPSSILPSLLSSP